MQADVARHLQTNELQPMLLRAAFQSLVHCQDCSLHTPCMCVWSELPRACVVRGGCSVVGYLSCDYK